MSRLDELIEELCPNGVEYKSLGEIATIARGGNFQKKISVIEGFHVFIMDKYIQSMVCLRIRRLRLLQKKEQKNKNLLKRMI